MGQLFEDWAVAALLGTAACGVMNVMAAKVFGMAFGAAPDSMFRVMVAGLAAGAVVSVPLASIAVGWSIYRSRTARDRH